MKSFSFILFFLLNFNIAASLNNDKPGNLILWSPSISSSSKPEYITRSIETSNINDEINNMNMDKVEVLALFTTLDDQSSLTHKSIENSFRTSKKSFVLSSIYRSKDEKLSGLMDNILKTDITKNINKPLTLLEFKNHLLQEKTKEVNNIFNNNKIDTFQVTLNGNEEDSILMSDINSIVSSPSIMFMAGTEPSRMAYIPQVKNQYSRVLTDFDAATSPPSSPEGTEFSIYYQNQYLYITPDIFTGLMTSLFIFFTIYIGFSCLGGIQTNDTYATRACSVGKTKD